MRILLCLSKVCRLAWQLVLLWFHFPICQICGPLFWQKCSFRAFWTSLQWERCAESMTWSAHGRSDWTLKCSRLLFIYQDLCIEFHRWDFVRRPLGANKGVKSAIFEQVPLVSIRPCWASAAVHNTKIHVILNPTPAEPGYALSSQTVYIQVSWLLKKPTDLHCLPFSIWICINNLAQVNGLAENQKRVWHLKD